MRNSASALALQLCLDFDQPVAPAKPVAPVDPEPTLFTATIVDTARPPVEAAIDFWRPHGRNAHATMSRRSGC